MRRGFDGVSTVSGESDDHPSGGFLSIGKGSAGPWHLKPIFVDFETLDFRIERSLGQPEFRGGAGWARDLSITFLECGFDDFLLPAERGHDKAYSRGYGHVRMPEAPAI